MKTNFESCLKALLKHEGGFVNHPKDPGGMTNLGVTKKVWEEWIGRTCDEAEMRSLTPEKVGPLYKKKYWDAVKGDELPSGVDSVVFDCAVNSGPGRAVKFLQEAVGTTADGSIGPKTLATVASLPAKDTINKYCDLRLAFLKSLKTFGTFGKGWTTRVNGVREESCKLI